MNSNGTTRSATVGRLLALLAAIMLVAAACSGSDDSVAETSDSDASGADAGAGEMMEEAAVEASDDGASTTETRAVDAGEPAGAESDEDTGSEDDSTGADAATTLGSGGARVTPTASDLGRKLIFTALLTVGVDDVAAASAEATAIIEELGGFLFGQNTTGGAQATSELTFKVLPDDFNTALERLGTVGELRNQSVATDDVTERIVDLESRIQVADLGVARLRAALEGAPTLEDYAEIERLLLDRESELELMRGQLRTLEDRVDLATITLVLTQDRVENAIDVQVTSYTEHDNGESCPRQDDTRVEAGTDMTICFEVVNVGDQTLNDIVLTDTVLEIDGETQLIEVFGSLEELAPGQSALVAHELNPERSLRLRTRVVAIPTDGVSPERAGPSVSTQVSFDVQTFEPETDPGFGDGFSVAVSILQGLWVAVKVTIGFVLPLLLLLPVVWLAWQALNAVRRRLPQRPTPPNGLPGAGQPPPPTPGGEPTVDATVASGTSQADEAPTPPSSPY